MALKQPSQEILVGGIVILTLGFANASINKKPETPVLVGSIGIVLLASLLDVASPGLSKIAVGLVGLAVVTSIITEGPALFQALNGASTAKPDTSTNVNNNTSVGTTSGGTPTTGGTTTGGGSSLHL